MLTKEEIESEIREEETTYRENMRNYLKESEILRHMQLQTATKCAITMSCRNITAEMIAESRVYANLALDYLKRYMSADEKEYKAEAKARREAADALPATGDDLSKTVAQQQDMLKAMTGPGISGPTR